MPNVAAQCGAGYRARWRAVLVETYGGATAPPWLANGGKATMERAMLIYHLRNTATGEEMMVLVNSEKEETEIRNLAAICAWEIIEVECG